MFTWNYRRADGARDGTAVLEVHYTDSGPLISDHVAAIMFWPDPDDPDLVAIVVSPGYEGDEDLIAQAADHPPLND